MSDGTEGKLYIEDHIPLSVAMAPEDGEIVDVGPYRHRVQWTQRNGGRLSLATYCNGCGCPVVETAHMDSLEGLHVDREFFLCPGCSSFQGWADEVTTH
jgi:hypothetical protein